MTCHLSGWIGALTNSRYVKKLKDRKAHFIIKSIHLLLSVNSKNTQYKLNSLNSDNLYRPDNSLHCTVYLKIRISPKANLYFGTKKKVKLFNKANFKIILSRMKLIFPIKSIPGIILWKSFIQIVFLCYLQTYKLYSVFVNENQC